MIKIGIINKKLPIDQFSKDDVIWKSVQGILTGQICQEKTLLVINLFPREILKHFSAEAFLAICNFTADQNIDYVLAALNCLNNVFAENSCKNFNLKVRFISLLNKKKSNS